MDTPYVKYLMIAVITGVVGSGLLFSVLRYSVYAQQNTPRPSLQCFHEGTVMASAPAVDDFFMKQTGIFIEVRWTNPLTKEHEILVTTLPCMFRATLSRRDQRPVN
jgi:hypothetical protein